MSYLCDKVACKGCGDLFDTDLLNRNDECRDCDTTKSEYEMFELSSLMHRDALEQDEFDQTWNPFDPFIDKYYGLT